MANKRRLRNLWLALAGAALALVLAYNLLMPDVAGLVENNPLTTAFMDHWEQRQQQAGRAGGAKQRWVRFSKISPFLVQAVLVAEDDRFFRHSGIDWEMAWQAFRTNLDAGRIKSGASTITQQLARNLYLSPQRSYWRKFREALIAMRLESVLSKQRILELYLNAAQWGPGVFGAQAAARYHFKTSAAKLSPWQAASLAAVLPSPLGYSPTRPSPYVAKRIKRIYGIMRKRGFGKIWK